MDTTGTFQQVAGLQYALDEITFSVSVVR